MKKWPDQVYRPGMLRRDHWILLYLCHEYSVNCGWSPGSHVSFACLWFAAHCWSGQKWLLGPSYNHHILLACQLQHVFWIVICKLKSCQTAVWLGSRESWCSGRNDTDWRVQVSGSSWELVAFGCQKIAYILIAQISPVCMSVCLF